MVINAPSLANINFMELDEKINELINGDVNFFHVDIMDGHYVKNLCFPVSFVRDLKNKYPHQTVDVHLMVDDPAEYIEQLHQSGTDYISFHCDSTPFVRRVIKMIRDKGMKAGVVINPSQQVEVIEPYAFLLDYVVLMSVEPGFSGQKFLSGSLERLKKLALFRKHNNLNFKISIDGGVNYDIAADCVRNGADIIVTNIYTIFNQPDGIVSACNRFYNTLKDVKCVI